MTLITDLKFALRSLSRAKGLAVTVVLTLALGIGANAAIFSVVRGVLLRPLVNRDEDRLIYIRQSAPGHRRRERRLLRARNQRPASTASRSLSAFGDFSTIEFTMVGLGEPRVVRAGVVGGSYFEVMGLRPVLGRLLDATRRRAEGGGRGGSHLPLLDDRARAAIHRCIGKTIRLGDAHGHHRRRPRAVGAVSGRNRDHRQRRDQPASPVGDDGGRARPSDDRAVRPPGAGRRPRRGARRAARRARRDGQGSIPRRIRRRPTSASTRCACAIRSPRRRGRCCWCCSRRRRWCSSSPAPTSPT